MSETIAKNKLARFAGMIYLVVVLTGIFSLAYVPGKLIVWDDAAATVHNIITSEPLFRLGIAAGLVCYTSFLFLPLVLYKLLRSVNEQYAKLMVILALISVPISFINMLNKFAVLSLVSGVTDLKMLPDAHLQEQVMFYLDLYNSGILIVQIFWGLWLFPFGYLVFKSGFLPGILGVLLIAGCIGYLINFFGYTLFPLYGKAGISSFVRLPATLGEIGICLWLLILGAKKSILPVRNGI